jgi:type III secretion system (T3SS) SseB-like protein
MSFEAENDLERALMRAPNDPSARPEFYRLLMDSTLFVIGKIEGHQNPQGQMQGDRLMIATIAWEGKNYHPVFSCMARLKAFAPGEEVEFLQLAGRALFSATKGSHFLLNPGSDFGKELSAEELTSIMGQTRVMIGQAKEYPKKLVDPLKDFFARTPQVKAAHIVQIAFEGKDEPPHPLIGIDAEGDWQALSQQIGEVMKTAEFDSLVDMVPINRNDPGGVMQALLKTPPFYARGK